MTEILIIIGVILLVLLVLTYLIKNKKGRTIIGTIFCILVLVESALLCIPILKIGGYFVPMKANIDDELGNANNSIKLLNSKLVDVITFKLPKENSNRNIIKIEKIDKTNAKYPRKFDKIKRNPL